MKASRWSLHVEEWKDCQRCELSATRRRIVLARGRMPCDVLFVGEAPGESEDVLGLPFVGPAGKLLDRIVERAASNADASYLRLAFTNIIACIPRDDSGAKAGEPSKGCIKACSPRLADVIAIAAPRLIVAVGKLSDAWTPKAAPDYPGAWVSIVHPAAILRANEVQRDTMVKRAVVTLANAMERLNA